ncbi:LysR family transcriptional regulator [Desulfomarina sp.]
MLENLSDLRLFVEIARLSSISAAGKKLQLSPAVASKRLQRLEDSLELLLVNRTTRQVSLTEEGQNTYKKALIILDAVDELSITGNSISAKTVKGRIRLTSPASFGRKIVAPCLSRFLSQYPLVKIELILDDMKTDLLKEGIDLAISIAPLHESNFIVRRIAENRKILVAGKSYIARHGEPAEFQDLRNHNALILGNYAKWSFINTKTLQEERITVKSNFSSNSGEATVAASKEGLGICIKSFWDVKDDIQNGTLVHILPEYVHARKIDITLLFPSKNFLPVRTRLLLDFLQENIRRRLE